MAEQIRWKSELVNVLPASIWEHVCTCTEAQRPEEIRIRAGQPIQMIYACDEALLPHIVDEDTCEALLENICDHSIYAWEEELKNCFITLRGGYRVGLSGRAYMEKGELMRLTRVNGFNIRIARECAGCAADIVRNMVDESGRPLSTLIFSAPGVGKTTMLRDIARHFSYGLNGLIPRKVSIADERSELAGSYNGVATLDVGPRTDVLDGCAKARAMALLIRTMSPELIITDEIGGKADADAIMDAATCGVAVIASAHARNVDELKQRESLMKLITNGCFKCLIELSRTGGRVIAKQVR
ncbi:MAG: stage III sporulation protein AA [Clostridia bacterium]